MRNISCYRNFLYLLFFIFKFSSLYLHKIIPWKIPNLWEHERMSLIRWNFMTLLMSEIKREEDSLHQLLLLISSSIIIWRILFLHTLLLPWWRSPHNSQVLFVIRFKLNSHFINFSFSASSIFFSYINSFFADQQWS